MDYNNFLNSAAYTKLIQETENEPFGSSIDLNRTTGIEVTKELYQEADAP